MLEVRGLSAGYLGESVVRGISLSVADGEAVTLIGSNGAGKTTVFRAMCGLLATNSGETILGGKTITGWPPHQVSRAGLVYVPAERHLFPRMTVEENLALGAFPHRPDPARRDLVFDLFPRLVERANQQAATMSGGEQQMLAVGRALMSKPRVLMLDEPTTGLAPKLAADAYRALAELKDQGLTLLVAEQQVPLALALADRGYVLENGVIGLSGPATSLANDPGVQRAYLGVT